MFESTSGKPAFEKTPKMYPACKRTASKAGFPLPVVVHFGMNLFVKNCSRTIFIAFGLALTTLRTPAETLLNAAVPAEMNGGGTAGNPSTYTLALEAGTPYAKDWGAENVYIGKSTSHNDLLIELGASGTNSGLGSSIGSEATSGNNSVTVTGAGSSWNAGGLLVGELGSNNSLNVQAGGLVEATSVVVGHGNEVNPALGSGNTLTVSGTGSELRASSQIVIGLWGSNNTLTVENGGKVSSPGYDIIGVNGTPNSATVTGIGSEWNYTEDLLVCNSSTLLVADGAAVSGKRGYVGVLTSSSASVTVSGSGSLWSNSIQTMVGGQNGSSFNTLKILDGAAVENQIGVVGNEAGSNSNTVLISGNGATWKNVFLFLGATGNSGNTIQIENGGLLMTQSSLDVADGNFFRIDGGFLANTGDSVAYFESLVLDSGFQIWDGTQWVTSTDLANFNIQYFSPEQLAESAAFTGNIYDNLAGYTILTTVPEPSAAFLFGSALTAAFALKRRRRQG